MATNSICQGSQTEQLWPDALDRNGLELTFAHQTFAWSGTAAVHVVVAGFQAKGECERKRLFSQNADGGIVERQVKSITPYLTDGSNLRSPSTVIKPAKTPMNGLPPMQIGATPSDWGHLTLTDEESDHLLASCPRAKPFVRPYMGAKDMINGIKRNILYLKDAPADVIRHPMIRKRLNKVSEMRGASKDPEMPYLKKNPTCFKRDNLPTKPFVIVPVVSSERREYIPMEYAAPPVIPSGSLVMVQDAPKGVFALLNSRMHNAWTHGVAGRLKSDISYSSGICYHTFPVPPGGAESLKKLEPLADAVLNARRNHPDRTLAELYDPNAMPQELRKAHKALDRAVDKLYAPRRAFKDDADRLGFLLGEYEKMAAPLVDARHEARLEAERRKADRAAKTAERKAAQARRARRVVSPYGAKKRIRMRAGELPGLFARPESSVNPQADKDRAKRRRSAGPGL